MTQATATQTAEPKARKRPRQLPAKLRNALFAEWAKLSPSLDWESTEREARLRFANETIGRRRPVALTSWAELTTGEAKRLLREMKERSGSNAAYRALVLGRIAVDLWGEVWSEMILERIRERFGVGRLEDLAPADAHAFIEELMSRIARRDGQEIEAVRKKFFNSRKE